MTMLERAKNYCEYEYRVYRDHGKMHGASYEKMLDRCYGAVMCCCWGLPETEENEIGKWWDDEMRPKLYSIR